jgi:uncharacterized protein
MGALLPMPENEPIHELPAMEPPTPAGATAAIAPVWHTIVLIAGILAVSATGASRLPGAHDPSHSPVHKIATYGLTAAMELAMFAWVLFGLRLNKTPLRALLGANSLRIRSIALDLGIAMLFWIGSLMVLGTLAIAWSGIEAAVTHRPLIPSNGQPSPSQMRTVRTLVQLAPSNAEEIAAWTLLCILAGFVEEAVFRGYLQRQFIAWGRGSAVAGVVFSALMFGAAHGYEGARAMFLIAVFGVLFSLLALFRRSLRAGMIAHSWQDVFAGLALAALKSQHFI